MSIITFFLLVLLVVAAAAVTVWAIGHFAPSTPPIVPRIVWGVAVFVILVTFLQATGILGSDVAIPRLR